MKKLVWTLVALGAVAIATLGAGTVGAAAPSTYTCTGGAIPAGTYSSLTVKGNCALPATGTVRVLGNMTVADGASLDATSSTALLNVGGNVTVGRGAILGLGCSLEEGTAGCSPSTSDRVNGNLTANGAAAVIVHNATIQGNVSIHGGGGNLSCEVPSPLGFPYFSVVEDSHIGGNASVSGLKTCWFGFIRNHTGGNVNIHNNTFGEGDANEIVTNVIRGNLTCSGNSVPAQIGDSEGEKNVVFGNKTGECAAV